MVTLWHAVGAPWEQGFMQRALVEVVLMAACGGALGCWIVLYELAFSAEALPHAMFPGLVGAALLGVPLVAGGAAGLLVAGGAIAVTARSRTIGRDTAVAIVFTSFFGLGALMALSPQSPPGISDLLFGDILGLAPSDLLLSLALAAVVLVSVHVLHARLIAVALDRLGARATGANPARVEPALLVLIALATLVAVQAMGNVFVMATLVAPAAAARPLARRLPAMMLLGAAIGIAAGVAGLYLSYYSGIAAGASIAALDVLLYGASRSLLALRSKPRVFQAPRRLLRTRPA